MSRPAVFFDRDNTLIANGDYLGDPEGVVLIDGAADAVARVRELGFATVVVSNQSGVARGLFDEAAVQAVNARMDLALRDEHADAVIDRHEFCPHHPDGTVADYKGDSARRKPQPGMLLDAADALGLDLRRSWLIGDAPRDVEAGQRAGCRTILMREPSLKASPAAAERMNVRPDYVATSLADAVDFIEMQLDTTDDGLTDPPIVNVQPPLIAASERDDVIVDSEEVDQVPVQVHEIVDEDDDHERAPAVHHVLDEAVEQARPSDTPDGDDIRSAAAAAVDDDSTPPTFATLEIPNPPPASVPSISAGLGAMSEAIVSSAPHGSSEKQTVMLLERVVDELRRANDPPQDFSVPRMLAGIVQGFALAALFGALLFRDAPPPSTTFTTLMMLAIFLQAMVSSLVLMGR